VASPFNGWSFGVSRDGLIIARTWHRDVAQEIAAALNVAEKARWIEEYEMRTQIETEQKASMEHASSFRSAAK
jgi:hypothetical protein